MPGWGRLSNGALGSVPVSPTHISSAADNSVMSGNNIRDTAVTRNVSTTFIIYLIRNLNQAESSNIRFVLFICYLCWCTAGHESTDCADQLNILFSVSSTDAVLKQRRLLLLLTSVTRFRIQ